MTGEMWCVSQIASSQQLFRFVLLTASSMLVTKDLKEKLERAKKVALIVPQDAGLDGLCGALALQHVFKAKERQVSVVFDGALMEEAKDLPGSDQITRDLGSKDLILRFNVGQTGIEKISYSVLGEILSLRIRPKKATFKINDFDYSYEDAGFNLFVTFGVASLKTLSFYKDYEETFSKVEVLNLGEPVGGSVAQEAPLGALPSEAKSISQFIFEQLAAWGITPSKEASLCLLKGMAL